MKQHYVRGKEDVKWVCSHRIKNGASSCNSFGISEMELLTMISDIINSSEFNIKECTQKYLDLFQKIINAAEQGTETENDLNNSINAIRAKMEKLLDYNLNGIITDEEFIKKNTEYKNDLFLLEQKLLNYKK